MEQSVLAVGAIIGVINAITKQFPQVHGLVGIVVSVLLGAVLGFFNYLGVEGIEMGILVGLSASGVYKVAQKVGGQQTCRRPGYILC